MLQTERSADTKKNQWISRFSSLPIRRSQLKMIYSSPRMTFFDGIWWASGWERVRLLTGVSTTWMRLFRNSTYNCRNDYRHPYFHRHNHHYWISLLLYTTYLLRAGSLQGILDLKLKVLTQWPRGQYVKAEVWDFPVMTDRTTVVTYILCGLLSPGKKGESVF